MSNLFATRHNFQPLAAGSEWQAGGLLPLEPTGTVAAETFAKHPLAGALQGFQYQSQTRDHKWFDYVFLGVLSVLIHGAAMDLFRGASLEQDFVEPPKPEPKVQITLSRPRPVVPPPIVQAPPPKPKVVPLKPPKEKPKPVLKPVVEQTPPPDPTPAPIVDAAPTPAPPAPPAPVVEEKITPPTAGADYLNNPPPEYPEIAQERGWEGKVLMKVHVQPNGKPDNVTVVKSSGQAVLDDAAVKTVSKWSFVPAKRGETPVAGYVTVPITFNLS